MARASAAHDAINDLFIDIARGVFPDDDTLDELDLSDEVVEAIRNAAAPVVAFAAAGMRGHARRQAAEAVREIVALVPSGWAPPTSGTEPLAEMNPRQLASLARGEISTLDADSDPRQLAARVPRF